MTGCGWLRTNQPAACLKVGCLLGGGPSGDWVGTLTYWLPAHGCQVSRSSSDLRGRVQEAAAHRLAHVARHAVQPRDAAPIEKLIHGRTFRPAWMAPSRTPTMQTVGALTCHGILQLCGLLGESDSCRETGGVFGFALACHGCVNLPNGLSRCHPGWWRPGSIKLGWQAAGMVRCWQGAGAETGSGTATIKARCRRCACPGSALLWPELVSIGVISWLQARAG